MAPEIGATEPSAQPLGGHLDELRRRLVRLLAATLLAAILAFAFAPALFDILLHPYHQFLRGLNAAIGGAMLQSLEPAETLKMSVWLSFLIAGVLVFPYACFEAWQFLRPGLKAGERRLVLILLAGGTVLFCGGVGFAYCLAVPMTLGFFWTYSLRLGITPAWTVAHYFGFVLGTLTAFGAAFELPILLVGLARFGIVRPRMLRTGRRYAYFLIAVAAAVLTPPDVVSMVLMTVPLLGLYELSVLGAALVVRPKENDHGSHEGAAHPG